MPEKPKLYASIHNEQGRTAHLEEGRHLEIVLSYGEHNYAAESALVIQFYLNNQGYPRLAVEGNKDFEIMDMREA